MQALAIYTERKKKFNYAKDEKKGLKVKSFIMSLSVIY